MPAFSDLTGLTFNNLKVLRLHPEKSSSNKNQWECLCACGKNIVVIGASLSRGTTKSCGCLASPDLTNRVYGRLTVIEKYEPAESLDRVWWTCLCSCGKYTNLPSTRLVSNYTQSCGCLRKDTHTTHGLRYSPIYPTWLAIKGRCYNKKNIGYENYGGRGITMSDEWLDSFETFYKDMGPRPRPEYSVDRRDNDKGYCKENCYWATDVQQANNKSNNKNYSYNEKTQTLPAWCRELNLDFKLMKGRIYKGMLFEEAIIIDKIRTKTNYTIDSVTKTIGEWSIINFLTFSEVSRRLFLGWTFREAISQITSKVITFNPCADDKPPETMSLEDWCTLLGLDKDSTYLSVLRGESFEDLVKK